MLNIGLKHKRAMRDNAGKLAQMHHNELPLSQWTTAWKRIMKTEQDNFDKNILAITTKEVRIAEAKTKSKRQLADLKKENRHSGRGEA